MASNANRRRLRAIPDAPISPTPPRPPTEDIIFTTYSQADNGSLASQSRVLQIAQDIEDLHHHSASVLQDRNEDNREHLDSVGNFPREEEIVCEPVKKKKKTEQPLFDWVKDREQFLSEFLRLEGIEDDSYCQSCRLAEPRLGRLRCIDCDGLELQCMECMVSSHRKNGLHRIEEWDPVAHFFRKVSLRSLGHIFQLGHRFGDACPRPEDAFGGSFTVIDLNGIHEVTLKFCGCEKKQHHFLQILRFGWFPATVGLPRTAVTMNFLKFFQILSFESKSTVSEVYQTLVRLTDNTGTEKVKDRYSALLRVVREYRHIKMLKRAGRGHDKEGAAGTHRGECAVLCPACPHPGINLEEGWQNAPPEKRFLNSLFLGLDANFRLKRRMISSNASDPSLSKGWSYFVEEDDFKDFLHKFGKLVVQEPSKCSNHDAVNKDRGRDGFAASGVGTCDCIRHDMKRPSSVGDLQKGERYVNMDYFFLSSLQSNELIEVVVSYDIVCQWSVYLWERMKTYPNWMHVDNENRTTFRFLIPKFHLPAHIRPCRTKFSFNYNTKVGRTDGEGVERGWSFINPIAASTKEMGPGSRRDTLDDHFGDWNWKKTTKLANSILRQLDEAVHEAAAQAENHAIFVAGLPSADISEWSQLLADWHRDQEKMNPFETTFKALSQDTVRRQLAEEESQMGSAAAFIMHESYSATQLITMGLEIEDEQQKLRERHKSISQHATDKQKTEWQNEANALQRKITSWIAVEEIYIPSLHLLRVRTAETTVEPRDEAKPYDIPLFLPSSLPFRTCDIRLSMIEYQLRYAQCTDALDDLRDGLCLRAFVLIDKSRFQRGQRANTRSQGVVDRIQGKVNRAVRQYRNGRNAVAHLAGQLGVVGWDLHLLELKDADIRPLVVDEVTQEEMKKRRRERIRAGQNVQDGFAEQGERTGTSTPTEQQGGRAATSISSSVGGAGSNPSEGRRTISWIWTRMGGEMDLTEDVRLHESLRVEWCKSKSRADRWQEEVELLLEERKRILAFFDFQAKHWDVRATAGDDSWMLPGVPFDQVSINGRVAYAREQATQMREMQRYCRDAWENVDAFVASKGIGVKLKVIQSRNIETEEETTI